LPTVDGGELAKSMPEGKGFMLTAQPGDVLIIPSGSMVASLVGSAGCSYFRKSISPCHAGEDDRVKSFVAQMLEAYPGLQQGARMEWSQFLRGISSA